MVYQTKEMTIIRVVVRGSGTLIVPYSVKPIIMPKSQEIWKRLQISAKSQAKDEDFMPVKYELLKRKNPKKATEKT